MPFVQRSIREVIRDFFQQSTSHGISHAVGAPSRNWRIFWVIIFLVCLILLCVQIINIIIVYLAYEKNVSINLMVVKAPFPSVTFCNLNPFKLSLLQNVSSAQMALEGLTVAMGHSSESEKNRLKKRKRALKKENLRYRPVSTPCLCDINKKTGKTASGGCLELKEPIEFPTYKEMKCLCYYNTDTRSAWPCFPVNEWESELCSCTFQGHCTMPVKSPPTPIADLYDKLWKDSEDERDPCLCNDDFNHCIANLDGDHIPELEVMNSVVEKERKKAQSTTTTTTQAPEVEEALGYQGMTDEVAIATKGKENIVFAVAGLSLEERTHLSYTKEEFILKCSFNGQQCDIEKDFQLHVDPSYGNCFTFNWNKSTEWLSTRAGANYGLRVLLYPNASDYLPTSEAVGIRLIAHPKNTVPFPDAFGYSAPTGFLSSFGIRMKNFIRLPLPYGKCKNDEEPQINYIYKNVEYSVEGCYRSCLQLTLVKKCHCADPRYPTLEKWTTCKTEDPEARKCLESETEHFALEGYEKCVCNQPCEENSYDTTYSTSRWPSGSAKVGNCKTKDELCVERYRINAVMVQVFYETLNIEVYKETPAYTFVNLMADFGGTTGLWLGISIISMLELIVFLYNLATACRFEKAERKKKLSTIEFQERKNSDFEIHKKSTTCMCHKIDGQFIISQFCPKHASLLSNGGINRNSSPNEPTSDNRSISIYDNL